MNGHTEAHILRLSSDFSAGSCLFMVETNKEAQRVAEFSVRWVRIRSLFRSLVGNLTELSLSILDKVALSTTIEDMSERLIPLHVTAHFV